MIPLRQRNTSRSNLTFWQRSKREVLPTIDSQWWQLRGSSSLIITSRAIKMRSSSRKSSWRTSRTFSRKTQWARPKPLNSWSTHIIAYTSLILKPQAKSSIRSSTTTSEHLSKSRICRFLQPSTWLSIYRDLLRRWNSWGKRCLEIWGIASRTWVKETLRSILNVQSTLMTPFQDIYTTILFTQGTSSSSWWRKNKKIFQRFTQGSSTLSFRKSSRIQRKVWGRRTHLEYLS